MFPAFEDQKRSKFKEYNVGVGSLSSYYEPSIGSEGSVTLPQLPNFAKGPQSLFPQLDVMPGAASAFNEAEPMNWGLKMTNYPKIDANELLYEEALGGLHGFRMNHKMEFLSENASVLNQTKGVFQLRGDTIDIHAGQSQFGRHVVSEDIFKQSKQIGTQHAMGDSQMARDKGLERGQNPAINGTVGEQAYHNSENIKSDEDTTVPVDIDAIKLNETVIHVEDTMQALDGNTAS